MEHLFFYVNEEIDNVARNVFKYLGSERSVTEGDSSHAIGGVYYSFSIFGSTIRLESNSYDYDDQYNYMISVKKNLLTDIEVDNTIIRDISLVVRKILLKNLKIPIAQEVGDAGLEIFEI